MHQIESYTAQVWSKLDPCSRKVAKRLLLKLASVPALSALVPNSFFETAQLGLMVYAAIALSNAVRLKEEFRSASLTHWDEALVFIGSWLLVH